MSKAVKTIISIAVAVAIPFAAPAIAASIGLSAAIGATAGSVLVGAGLGAINASVMGGDVGRGALMGGIGGGIGGYNYTPSVSLSGGGAPVYDYNAATNSMIPAPGFGGATAFEPTNMSSYTNPIAQQQAGAQTFGGGPTNMSGYTNPIAQQQAGLDTATFEPTNMSGYANPTAQQAAVEAQTFAGEPTNMSSYTNPAAQQQAGLNTATAVTAPAKPTTFAEALKQVPGEIAKRFTDPSALADLTLRAAGQLAGSLIAGDGLSAEERALLDAQTQELRNLQQTNAGLFAQRLEQAQNLMGESKYFDPEYFGLQRARRAQTAAARAKRAGLRGLEGASRAAEARRFDLATARDVGSSFDQGYLTGVQGRLGAMQAGMNAMPTSYPSSMGDYTNLRGAYTAANQRKRETQTDIGNLFGSLTGGYKSQSLGP